MNNTSIYKASDDGYISVVEGIKRKTLVFGEKTLLTEFRLAAGKKLPLHRHSHEQTGYLVSGRMIFSIDGVKHTIMPGDSWAILGNVEHSAEIIEDSIAIEVFSPVREDFL
ncbi:MAG: cupin domain-containing protein [Bacillota bacterium]|nr:cupin domain-containing protein [Bacillota bacterium]MDW7683584.1 cupin domain-containing protein [Bacillota bacterium]